MFLLFPVTFCHNQKVFRSLFWHDMVCMSRNINEKQKFFFQSLQIVTTNSVRFNSENILTLKQKNVTHLAKRTRAIESQSLFWDKTLCKVKWNVFIWLFHGIWWEWGPDRAAPLPEALLAPHEGELRPSDQQISCGWHWPWSWRLGVVFSLQWLESTILANLYPLLHKYIST